jgi:hypothetical protein
MVRIFFVFSVVLNCVTAQADVLFEGYSKVYSGGAQVGFVSNRYEFDAKKKQFVSLSLLKTNALGGNITESLKAYAKEDMTPISYEYTTLVDGVPKLVDAKFTNGKILATIKQGDKISKVDKVMPRGTFLSTFLVYVMLKGPKGLTPELKYDYMAIAEEDADIVGGVAYIKNKETQNGLSVFKILNDFKGTKFISYVTSEGEVLSTKSPVQSISTELVPLSSMATNGMQMPTALMKNIFGDVPLGVANQISKRYQSNPKGFQTNEAQAASAPADAKDVKDMKEVKDAKPATSEKHE